MGAEAVMALMEADESEPPCVVSLDGNQVTLPFVSHSELTLKFLFPPFFMYCRLFECH